VAKAAVTECTAIVEGCTANKSASTWPDRREGPTAAHSTREAPAAHSEPAVPHAGEAAMPHSAEPAETAVSHSAEATVPHAATESAAEAAAMSPTKPTPAKAAATMSTTPAAAATSPASRGYICG
jgi:hypothetical protein